MHRVPIARSMREPGCDEPRERRVRVHELDEASRTLDAPEHGQPEVHVATDARGSRTRDRLPEGVEVGETDHITDLRVMQRVEVTVVDDEPSLEALKSQARFPG